MPPDRHKNNESQTLEASPPSALSSLTLTPSEAIARSYRSEHAMLQRKLGLSVWETPRIHSLQRWCRDQWLQTWPAEQLLHPVQELVLWQRVISADHATTGVLATGALARQARAAANVITRYQLDPATMPLYTDEHRAFARWHARVRVQMNDAALLTEPEIPACVAKLVELGEIKLPTAVRLRGFSRPFTPAEQRLLDAMHATGITPVVELPEERQSAIRAVACNDDVQQFRQLAARLQELLLPYQDSDSPPPTLVVACPDLEGRRQLIDAIFRPVLAPWLLLPGEDLRPVPWRFAMAPGLDQAPLIAVALVICALSEHDNTMDSISRLLLASILWTPEQRELTSRADYTLRREGGTRFPMAALLRHMPESIRQPFNALHTIMQDSSKRILPSAWAAHFEQRLAALGWPGLRTLPSAVFQSRESWLQALASFSSMDGQIGTVGHGEAMTWLREIISGQPFQPRTDYLQPIQIVPLAEAAGLSADHLFVVDATDAALPGPPQRMPLLATEALFKVGVPAATPALALESAKQLTTYLIRSHDKIEISYATIEGNGAERTPTALFGADLEWEKPEPILTNTAAERCSQTGPHTFVPTEDPVPPVEDPVSEGITGGVAIFKDYVEAPFFAFCKYRLGITELQEPTASIPAYVQGNIIHKVLEEVWRHLRTLDKLKTCDRTSLNRLLDPSLDRAMSRELPVDRYGRMLRTIERARLRDVILQWLMHEVRRIDKFEAINFELKVQMSFQRLPLTLIIDRVDRIMSETGEKLLIIDYKAGREADTGGWNADKLKQPQLPLYATSDVIGEAGIPRVDGICFAHVKDGHPALAAATNWTRHLVEEKDSQFIPDWNQQLLLWRERLITIAQGFLAGDASIDLSLPHDRSHNAALLGLLREDS